MTILNDLKNSEDSKDSEVSEVNIKLSFINPITKKQDNYYLKKSDLEIIRADSDEIGDQMISLSFLYKHGSKLYSLELVIDKDCRVRTVNKNRFCLSVKDKLFLS